MFEQGHIEIHQETESKAGQFQVGEWLSLIDGREHVDGFDLNDHYVIDDKIETVACVEGKPAIHNGKRDLSFDLDATFSELIFEAMFVGGFEQSWPKGPVDLETRVDRGGRGCFRSLILHFVSFVTSW